MTNVSKFAINLPNLDFMSSKILKLLLAKAKATAWLARQIRQVRWQLTRDRQIASLDKRQEV